MMLVDLDRGRAEGIALARTLDDLGAGRRDSFDQRDDSEDDLN
jgi:UMF1 family MFS transporter